MYVEKEVEQMYNKMNSSFFLGRLPVVRVTTSKAKIRKKYWYVEKKERIWNIRVHIDCLQQAINRPDVFCGQLLHQIIHIYCAENKIKETCRGEQYHNKIFAEYAEMYGIKTELVNGQGYVDKGLEDREAEKIMGILGDISGKIASAFKEDAKLEINLPRSNEYMIEQWCPVCHRHAKTSVNTKLICGWCYVDFIPK